MDIEKGIYRHYKGKNYQVIDVVYHSETLEPLVPYKALYTSPDFGEHALWIRPLKMFFENVEVDGKIVPRFELVK